MSDKTVDPNSQQLVSLVVNTVEALLKDNPNYDSFPEWSENPAPICIAAVMEMLSYLYGIADSIERSATNDPEALKAKEFIRLKFGETPPIVNRQGFKLN